MMGTVFQFEWEVKLICFFQQLLIQYPFLKTFFVIATWFGEPFFAAFLASFLYWGKKKKLGLFLILCLMMSQLFNSEIKNIVMRLRPYMVNDSILCLKPVKAGYDLYDVAIQGYSFPSGHSSGITTLGVGMYLYTKEKRNLFLFLPLILFVGISRFSLGVHYPSDVFAGIITAIGETFLVYYFYRKQKKKELFSLMIALTLLGFFFCRSEDFYTVAGLLLGFVFGTSYEERKGGFQDAKTFSQGIIRMIIKVVIFLCISGLLKVLISALSIQNQMLNLLLRTLRYFLASFVTFGFNSVFSFNGCK